MEWIIWQSHHTIYEKKIEKGVFTYQQFNDNQENKKKKHIQ